MTEDRTEERYVVELTATLTPAEALEAARRAAPQLGQQVERVQRLLAGAPGPITKPLEPRLARGVAEVLRRAGAQVALGRAGGGGMLLSSSVWPAVASEREPPASAPTVASDGAAEGAAAAPSEPAAASGAGPGARAEITPEIAPETRSTVPSGVAEEVLDERPIEDDADASGADAAEEATVGATLHPSTAPPEHDEGGAPTAPDLDEQAVAGFDGFDATSDEVSEDSWDGADWDGSAPRGAAPSETPLPDEEEGGSRPGPSRPVGAPDVGAVVTGAAGTVGAAGAAAEVPDEREDEGIYVVDPAEAAAATPPPRDFDWGPSRWTQLRRVSLLLLLVVALVVLVLLQMNRASAAGGRTLDYDAGLEAYRRADFVAALGVWEGVATGGHARAMYMLGYMAEQGQGQPWSNRRAAGWYRQAAERGLPEAQLALASLYQRGLGVPQSDVQAARWYGLAARQGLPEAQLRYAWVLFEGRGVARDFDAALAWFEQAARQGLPEAEALLAFSEWRGAR